MCGATISRPVVRIRVASSDWCASRNVVSVTPTAGVSRIQRAKPSGPNSISFCLLPAGGGAAWSSGGSLSCGYTVDGRGPCGWFTVTSAR